MIPYSSPKLLISILFPRLSWLKPIPFRVAHTYIAYIWEYPPLPCCYSLPAGIPLDFAHYFFHYLERFGAAITHLLGTYAKMFILTSVSVKSERY